MNKKIKMIELLNMIANGKLKNNTKFNIINEDGDIIKCKYSSIYPGHIWVIDNEEVPFTYKIDHLRILNYEVEILEDNTEEINIQEIEEIDEYLYQGSDLPNIKDGHCVKTNELIRAIKQLDRAVNKLRKEKSNDK